MTTSCAFAALAVTVMACLRVTCGYRILVFTIDGGSHVILAGELSKRLIQRGHDVTFLVGSSMSIPEPVERSGVKVQRYDNPHPVTHSEEYYNALRSMVFGSSFLERMSGFKGMAYLSLEMNDALFRDSKTLEKLKAMKFDYAVIDVIAPSSMLLAYVLDIPYSFFVPECYPWLRSIPTHHGFVPSVNTRFTDDMRFHERLLNRLSELMIVLTHFWVIQKEELPANMPTLSVAKMVDNADLCLHIRDNILDFQRPQMSDLIPMSAIMARPAEPLISELEIFMNASKNGVILVSFGSVIPELPEETLSKFLEVFEALPYDIIFKYRVHIPSVPSNVKVMKWVPQNDLLGHPKLILFLTHAGYNSIIEAAYHGVPLVVAPFAFDQNHNAVVAQSKGIGKYIDIANANADTIHDAVVNVIREPRFRENAKKLSSIFREVIQEQGKDPAFWIEHVIRYGADHLRSRGREMPWYQYLMLDVYAAIAGIIVFICYIFIKVFIYIARAFRGLAKKCKGKLKTH